MLGWRAETRLDPDGRGVLPKRLLPLLLRRHPPFGGGDFLDVALGDLEEDSDLDAVHGLESGRVLGHRNTVGDGSRWTRYEIDNLADRVEAVAIGPSTETPATTT